MSKRNYPPMPSHGVKFIGYIAQIVAIKTGGDVDCAVVDFISGATTLQAEGGHVMGANSAELATVIADLPLYVDKLKELKSPGDGSHINLVCGENNISVSYAADIDCFFKQITQRYSEIKQMLPQIEAIGSRIERRPYSEYLDELAKTGIARVVLHGYGVFADGQFSFYPENRTLLIRSSGPEGSTFEIQNGGIVR